MGAFDRANLGNYESADSSLVIYFDPLLDSAEIPPVHAVYFIFQNYKRHEVFANNAGTENHSVHIKTVV